MGKDKERIINHLQGIVEEKNARILELKDELDTHRTVMRDLFEKMKEFDVCNQALIRRNAFLEKENRTLKDEMTGKIKASLPEGI